MFKNTIYNKNSFVNDDGIEMIDLTDTIFDSTDKVVTCTFYKVSKEMEMRPDLLSISSFGDDSYTEMILKYSEISNPFAICEDDLIAVPILNSIYDEVKSTTLVNNGLSARDLIKNYHKYIDKSKIPATIGSEVSNIEGNKNMSDASPVEPNMSNSGSSGISIMNGRIYFGPNVSSSVSDITDVEGDNIINSDLVDCAKNGVTVGQFLNAAVKNSLKK